MKSFSGKWCKMKKTFLTYLSGAVVGLLLTYIVNWLIIANSDDTFSYVQYYVNSESDFHAKLLTYGYAYYQEISTTFLILTPLFFMCIICWAVSLVRRGNLKARHAILGITGGLLFYILTIVPCLNYYMNTVDGRPWMPSLIVAYN